MAQIHNTISKPPKPWFILIIVARPKESNNYFTTHIRVLQPLKTLTKYFLSLTHVLHKATYPLPKLHVWQPHLGCLPTNLATTYPPNYFRSHCQISCLQVHVVKCTCANYQVHTYTLPRSNLQNYRCTLPSLQVIPCKFTVDRCSFARLHMHIAKSPTLQVHTCTHYQNYKCILPSFSSCQVANFCKFAIIKFSIFASLRVHIDKFFKFASAPSIFFSPYVI